jgi:uroporphyrinogen decarboxylase
MTSRERITRIINRQPADRCGFWMGNPHPDTLPIYHAYFGTSTLEELHLKLGSDFRWTSPQFFDTVYRPPDGSELFSVWKQKHSLGEPGPLAECETVEEIDRYPWPEVRYVHFEECLEALRGTGDFYRASGFWAPFYHDVMDLFGVEDFMIKMHTTPEVIEAAFDHACTFYLAANALFFEKAEGLIDGYFFGNDFGTQRELMIHPAHFERFLLPWIRRFTAQAHDRGFQVILHSCGSVHRVIGELIDSGIQCLHPLQALAHNMSAETLARDFGGKIAWLGGIDTQELLVRGSPAAIKEEVHRLINTLGPHLIVSPSHEALLPNIPPANVAAMAEAALGEQQV